MLPENELINDFQLDIPYERGPVVSDYIRNTPEIYRTQHFPPRPPFRLTRKEMAELIRAEGGKYVDTIRSFLVHAFSYVDLANSLDTLKRNRSDLFVRAA
jgi:hypothetical protein